LTFADLPFLQEGWPVKWRRPDLRKSWYLIAVLQTLISCWEVETINNTMDQNQVFSSSRPTSFYLLRRWVHSNGKNRMILLSNSCDAVGRTISKWSNNVGGIKSSCRQHIRDQCYIPFCPQFINLCNKLKCFLQPILMFVGKSRSLPYSGVSKRGFTWVCSSLTPTPKN